MSTLSVASPPISHDYEVSHCHSRLKSGVWGAALMLLLDLGYWQCCVLIECKVVLTTDPVHSPLTLTSAEYDFLGGMGEKQ